MYGFQQWECLFFPVVSVINHNHASAFETSFNCCILHERVIWLNFFWGFQIVAAFMPRIKAGRILTGASLCDFNEADETQKVVSIFII